MYQDFLEFIGVKWKLHHPGVFYHLQTHQLACRVLTPTFYKLFFFFSTFFCSVGEKYIGWFSFMYFLSTRSAFSKMETIILASVL